MKQASLKLNLNVKKTRKQVFLEHMERVVPWAALVELIAPYYPEGKTGRPPFSLQTVLRVHLMQQWFTLSDPGMEEAFLIRRCIVNLPSLKSLAACQMRAPSCALAKPQVHAIGWRSTNWPIKSLAW